MVMAACLCNGARRRGGSSRGSRGARRGDDRPPGRRPGGVAGGLRPRGGGRDVPVVPGAGAAADGWRVGETRCGELASILCGACGGVGGVALDPLPEMLEDGRRPWWRWGGSGSWHACWGCPAPVRRCMPSRERNTLAGYYRDRTARAIGLAELLRTPYTRRAQNCPSTHSGA